MNLQTFSEAIQEALYNYEDWDGNKIKYITNFEEAGLLTKNIGLVVRLEDGSEYQLTIVPSNAKANEEDEEDEED